MTWFHSSLSLASARNHWLLSQMHHDSALTFLTTYSISAQSNFICPEKDGYFEDPRQCDKYYDCYDGIPEERLCPDGLVFDPFSRKREPCDHYFNVDCGDRLDLRKFSKIDILVVQIYFVCRATKGTQWPVPPSQWFLLPPWPICLSHFLLLCWWSGRGVHLLLWTLVWRIQRSVQLGRADWQEGLQGWGLW